MDQLISDINNAIHMNSKLTDWERAKYMVLSPSQHRVLFNTPKPFEYAKLEQWKPSKHAKR